MPPHQGTLANITERETTELATDPMRASAKRTISVDNVLFGCEDGALKVLLIKHGSGESLGHWGLPGDWLQADENLETAAVRVLRARAGLDDIVLEQLQSFSSLDRYPGERTITTAFYALIRPDEYLLAQGQDELGVAWFTVSEMPELIFDHAKIVNWAIARLRHKVQHEPVGLDLLPKKFTLLELQRLYEALLGTALDKPNFRRKITKMNILNDCNEKQRGAAHRAASLFSFNQERYEQLSNNAFIRPDSSD